jgi:hypothetical protein
LLVQGVPEYAVLYRILGRGDMNINAMVDALALALSRCELDQSTETVARDLILQLGVAGYRIVESENQK